MVETLSDLFVKCILQPRQNSRIAFPAECCAKLLVQSACPVFRCPGWLEELAAEQGDIILDQQARLIKEQATSPVDRRTQDLALIDCQIRNALVDNMPNT